MIFEEAERKGLATELITRGGSDFRATTKSQHPTDPMPWEDVQKIRADNTCFLKEIVDKFSWPSNSLVGQTASHWAWFIAQHSDHDIDFQEKCLQLMKNLPKGDTNLPDLAHLEDRVRVNRGKKQLYGTQFSGATEQTMTLQPVEKPDELEIRRKEMGLEVPFEMYHNKTIASQS